MARVVFCYVHHADEVRTDRLIDGLLSEGKSVVIPYCEGQELKLFQFHSWDELVPGRFGIREPRLNLRRQMDREVAGRDVEIALVPGVGFDRRGTRLGHGWSFFDRLLAKLPSALRIGLAFECQLVDELPREDWDVPMHRLVTQERVYQFAVQPGETCRASNSPSANSPEDWEKHPTNPDSLRRRKG